MPLTRVDYFSGDAHGDSFFWCPPYFYTSEDSSSFNTGAVSPLGSRHCFAKRGYSNSARSIGSLLFWGSPSAIILGIWAVIVDAVNRVHFRWARSHIGRKIVEARFPCIAHNNAARSVSWILRGGRGIATILHPAPYLVQRMNRLFWRSWSPRCNATAGFSIAASEIAKSYDAFTTTIAKTVYVPNPSVLRSKRQDTKLAKSFSDECAFGGWRRHAYMVTQR